MAVYTSDPVAYRTDVLGEFADAESGLLNPIVVRQHTRDGPELLPFDPSKRYTAAVDPSEGSTKGNGFTLVLVEVDGRQDEATFRVALAREWRGVRPDEAWSEIAGALRPYHCDRVWTDQYAATANADLARRYRLNVFKRTTTALSKSEMFTSMASLIHQGRVELSPNKVLVGDLLALRKRVNQTGGYSIILPRTSDGRHCDFAPSLASALRETGYRSPWDPSHGSSRATGHHTTESIAASISSASERRRAAIDNDTMPKRRRRECDFRKW